MGKPPKPHKSLLARNIAQLRKAKGWNQFQLAEAADLGESTIKQIESDASAGNSVSRSAIARALGCEIEDLYRADPAPAPTTSISSAESFYQYVKSLEAEIKDLRSRPSVADPLSQAVERATPSQKKAISEILGVFAPIPRKAKQVRGPKGL